MLGELVRTMAAPFRRAAPAPADVPATVPAARVYQPDMGYIPYSWSVGFWQQGRNVLPYGGEGAIVEACVSAYARAISMLPADHYRTLADGGTETVINSALHRFMRKPNEYQTRPDFVLSMVRSLLYYGNAYALAVRNNRQEVAELHWLNPRYCMVHSIHVEGSLVDEIFYSIGGNELVEDGLIEAGQNLGRVYIPARDIFHVRINCDRHPLIGETPLMHVALELSARGAITANLANFFKNMSRPSGVITTEMVLSKVQVDELRERWIEQSSGMNAGGVPILTAGLKWQPVGMTQNDAKIIDALKLTDQQVAMVYGVPLLLLNMSEGATFASAEALMNYWLAAGLGFYLELFEENFGTFFGLAELDADYCWFDRTALLRTAFKERIEALSRATIAGIYAPNEARKIEGLGKAKDGDEPRVQQQVVPLSAWSSAPPATPAPGAPGAPPPSGAAASDGGGRDKDEDREEEDEDKGLTHDEVVALNVYRLRKHIQAAEQARAA